MPDQLNILDLWLALNATIALLKRDAEGQKRVMRKQRYVKLRRARRKRDNGKWSAERFNEELAEINRLYPVE